MAINRACILAGGEGSRLAPLCFTNNKHLLPVYSKPMIFYPIETLVQAGIKEVLIVVSGRFAGNFISVLKNGKELGLNHLEYAYQEGSGGIAAALSLAEDFADGENIAVILGDNTTDADISKEIDGFQSGAHIFLKEVPDPERFGVARFENEKIVEIIEKPSTPPSSFAATGLYLFDSKVFDHIRKCKPSKRNEMEITDVLNHYIAENNLSHSMLNGYWQDAGCHDNLFLAGQYWYEKSKKENKCLQ